jgi:iron complex outermembrane receptor protein
MLAPEFGPDLTTGRWDDFADSYDNKGRTYSGFGQLRWDPLEDVELAGGARYTKETKSLLASDSYLHYIVGPAFGLAPVGQQLNLNYEGSNWSPEATATYHPTRDSTLYAAYKTGYKSGGFSNPATLSATYLTDPSQVEFGPERAEGFEGGYKTELFDRSLRAEITLYRYTFRGLQLSARDPSGISYYIQNAGVARTTGVETALNWRVTQDVSLHADGAYNRAVYVSFDNGQCYAGQTAATGCINDAQNLSGSTLPRAPRVSANGGASYDTPISTRLKIGVTGDAFYTSEYNTIDNNNPLVIQPRFWRFNASLRLIDDDDHWTLSVIGRNLSDKSYRIAASDKSFGLPGELSTVDARPREVVLQAEYRF